MCFLAVWFVVFGAPLGVFSGEMELSLIHEANLGNVTRVKELLEMGADVNDPGKSGWTALMYACYRGHEEVVRLLLDKGAAATSDETMLIVAAGSGNPEIVRMLLAAGAPVDTRNEHNGDTPLIWAASLGHTQVVQVLVENGANISARNKAAMTALGVAAINEHKDTLEFLISKGADANVKDTTGATVLFHLAGTGRSIEIMRILLDNGADVNVATPRYGWTPLLAACAAGRTQVAELLLNRGADASVVGYQGFTPLTVAVRNGHIDVAALLIRYRITIFFERWRNTY
jgi:ankyrin repeat protein